MRRLLTAALAVLVTVSVSPRIARAAGPEAVTRADAESFLRQVEAAYTREDLDAILALTHDDGLRQKVKYGVGRLFRRRNYFQLEQRILSATPREDGSLELDLVVVLRSRGKKDRADRREKDRITQLLARRDGRVVLVGQPEAPVPRLSDDAPWSPEDWTGRVALLPEPRRPFGSAEGRAEIELTLRLRNRSTEAQGQVRFGLHPFVGRLEVVDDTGASLPVERDEGVADIWTVNLPRPLPGAAAVELRLSYGLDEVGEGTQSRIGPGFAHLFAGSAWYPQFRPPDVPGLQRATHDLTVEVPAGWTAVAPGVLATVEDRAGDRRSLRWFSRFPGAELAIVAGELVHEEHRLTAGVSLDLYRQPDDTTPTEGLVEALGSIVARAEELAGKAPADRLTVVQSRAPGLRAMPGFLVVDTLEPQESEIFQDRRDQPLFFLAHHVYHLWYFDAMRPVGGPAQVLSEALCDHLALDWLGREVSEILPAWHRERVLEPARGAPDADRALVTASPGAHLGDIFGQGKGLVVLDGYRVFAGEDRWRQALSSYHEANRGRDVSANDLLDAFAGDDARLRDYLAAWVLGRGFADFAVKAPRVVELPREGDAPPRYLIEVEIENLGIGPAPVQARTLLDRDGTQWAPWLFELGTHELTVLRFEAEAPLKWIELDPGLLAWQSDVMNDAWPEKKVRGHAFPGEKRKLTEKDAARIEALFKELDD